MGLAESQRTLIEVPARTTTRRVGDARAPAAGRNTDSMNFYQKKHASYHNFNANAKALLRWNHSGLLHNFAIASIDAVR